MQKSGICIKNDSNETETVFFMLGLINGDNLGLHTILSFTESFSANYCCRFCTMHKSAMRKAVVENVDLIRTPQLYESHVNINNLALTGIKENCIWNILPEFNVTTNYSVDIMHDLFEGICIYDLTNLLNTLIFSYYLFSVDTLNSRIQFFSYNEQEKSNKPPLISAENLKNQLKMSASEMLCFSRYLGLMIGDLIPPQLPIWKLWVKLREIIDFVTSAVKHRDSFKRLQVLVEEHNSLYVTYFNDLKPKHHHLLHYHRVMQMSGPLLHLWSMRAEQKHKQSKMTSNISCNFKNIIHTLSLKSQLKLCKHLNNFSLAKPIEYNNVKPISFLDHSIYFTNFELSSLFSLKWFNYCGTLYKIDMTLVLKWIEDTRSPLFGTVKTIFYI